MNAGTVETIKAKMEALTEQYHTISAKLYEQAAQNAQDAQGAQGGQGGPQGGFGGGAGFNPNMGGAGFNPNMGGFGGGFNPGNMGGGFNPNAGAQGGQKKDDTVVDADFEVVDDNK
jgi:molecular chaperone DnaK